MIVDVPIRRLPHAAGLPLPTHASAQAAGIDLMAAIPAEQVVAPGEFRLVPTGIAIALPDGFEAQVRPRSGLAARAGISLVNAPGTIDADYRGEIQVIVINHGREPFTITPGMRIAQMVVAPVVQVRFRECDALSESARGAQGFGSTGLGPDAPAATGGETPSC